MRHKIILGSFLFFIAYCLVGIISGLSKHLQTNAGFSPFELAFFNFLVIIIYSIPWVVRKGSIEAFRTAPYGLIFIRSLFGFVSFVTFFIATHKIPLINAVTLFNTSPLWVPLIAAIMLKEHISWKVLICIIFGFFGMLLVVHPRFGGMNLAGDLYGLVSGSAVAFALVYLRRLRNEPWQKVTFIYAVVCAIISLFFIVPSFKLPQGSQWLLLLAMGSCFYFVQCLVIIALHFAKASTLSISQTLP